MSNLQNCTSLKDATGKPDYRLTNDCMFHVVFQKSRKALRGLCASLLHMYPEKLCAVEVLNPIEFGEHPQDKDQADEIAHLKSLLAQATQKKEE